MCNGVAKFLALIPLILGLSLNAAVAQTGTDFPIIRLAQEVLADEIAAPWDDTSSEPVEDDPVVCLAPTPSLNGLLSPNFGPLELSLKPAQMGLNFRLDLMRSFEILSESHSPREMITAFAISSNPIKEIKAVISSLL